MKDGQPLSEPFHEEANRKFSDTVTRAARSGITVGNNNYAIRKNVGSLEVGVLYDAGTPEFSLFVSPNVPDEKGEFVLHTLMLSYEYLDPDSHRIAHGVSSQSGSSASEKVKDVFEVITERDRKIPPGEKPQNFLDMRARWEAILKRESERRMKAELESIMDPDEDESMKGIGDLPLHDMTTPPVMFGEAMLDDHQLSNALFGFDPEEVIKISQAIEKAFFPENQDDLQQAEAALKEILAIQ